MSILTPFRRLGSTMAAIFGGHGAVTRLARRRDVSRQSVYREADAVLQELEGDAARQQARELRAAKSSGCGTASAPWRPASARPS